MEQMIKVNQLQVSYYDNTILENINLSINKGKLVGIIGPNGAGKSSLIKAMLDLVPIDQGSIQIDGKSVKQMRKKVAYIPQRNQIDWDFPITVEDTVLIGTYPHLGWFKRPGKQDREWSISCLERVGMEAFSKRQIGELSGGQQQRVFLARALAQKTDIFFMDEPFVGIDASSEETMIGILKKLRDEGSTILVVHHDLSKASAYFDQLVLINKQLIQFGEAEDVCDPEVMVKAYQSQLPFLNAAGGVGS